MTQDPLNVLLSRLIVGWENEVVEFKQVGTTKIRTR